MIKPGAVVDGYRFVGGNPSDQSSWEPVGKEAPKIGLVMDGYRFLGGDPKDESRWQAITEKAPSPGPSSFEGGQSQQKLAEDNAAYEGKVGFLQRLTNNLKMAGLAAKSAVTGSAIGSLSDRANLAEQGLTEVPIGTAGLFGDAGASMSQAQGQEVAQGARKGLIANAMQLPQIAREQQAIPMRPATRAFMTAENMGQRFDALKTDAAGIIGDLGVQSAPLTAPALGAALVNPALGIGATLANSAGLEKGLAIADLLQEKLGANYTEENAAKLAADPAFIEEAKQRGLIRGSIIGTLDAASMGIGGKMLTPFLKNPVAREITNDLVAQPIAQMALGAGGEALGQIATDGKITNLNDVFAEALGETFTAPIEVGVMAKDRIADLATPQSTKLARAIEQDVRSARFKDSPGLIAAELLNPNSSAYQLPGSAVLDAVTANLQAIPAQVGEDKRPDELASLTNTEQAVNTPTVATENPASPTGDNAQSRVFKTQKEAELAALNQGIFQPQVSAVDGGFVFSRPGTDGLLDAAKQNAPDVYGVDPIAQSTENVGPQGAKNDQTLDRTLTAGNLDGTGTVNAAAVSSPVATGFGANASNQLPQAQRPQSQAESTTGSNLRVAPRAPEGTGTTGAPIITRGRDYLRAIGELNSEVGIEKDGPDGGQAEFYPVEPKKLQELTPLASVVKQVFGKDVVFFNGPGSVDQRGNVDGGNSFRGVFLSNKPTQVAVEVNNEPQFALATTFHEVDHAIANMDRVAHKAWRDTLIGLSDFNGYFTDTAKKAVGYDNLVASQGQDQADVALSDYMANAQNLDNAQQEFAANYAGSQWVDPEFIRQLRASNPGKFNQIANTVIDQINAALAKIRGLIATDSLIANDSRVIEYVNDLEKARAEYIKYLNGAVDRVGSNTEQSPSATTDNQNEAQNPNAIKSENKAKSTLRELSQLSAQELQEVGLDPTEVDAMRRKAEGVESNPTEPTPRDNPKSTNTEDLFPGADVRFNRKGQWDGFPRVVISTPLAAQSSHPDYQAAKAGDDQAAARLAADLVSKESVADLVSITGRDVTLLPVLAIESSGENQIPLAVANEISFQSGVQVNTDVNQAQRVSRSSANGFERLARQPSFTGLVKKGGRYVLVDDTLTQGGTFAQLKTFVEDNGGVVAGSYALSGKMYSATLAPSPQSLEELRGKYPELESWWQSEFGYGLNGLTQSEVRYLAKSGLPFNTVRERISSAKDEGISGANEGVPQNPSDSLDAGLNQEQSPDNPQFSRRDTAAPEAAFFNSSLPTTVEVDGTSRPTTNNLGQPIASTEEAIQNFWRWFGDSKVVDADGRPLVVYHGTAGEFNTFKPSNIGTLGPGIYFAFSRDAAQEWAGRYRGGRVIEAYLRAENPVELASTLEASGLWDRFAPGGSDREMVLGLRQEGYDAVLVKNGADTPFGKTLPEIAVFDPTQIKSATGNNGQFDPTNPDIRRNQRQQPNTGLKQQVQVREQNVFERRVKTDFVDDKERFQFLDRLVAKLNIAPKDQNGQRISAYDPMLTYVQRTAAMKQNFERDEIQPLRMAMKKAGISADRVMLYAYAQHARERNAAIEKINPGTKDGSGMPNAVAQAILLGQDVTWDYVDKDGNKQSKEIRGYTQAEAKKAADFAQKWRDVIEGTRQLLVNSGQESVDRMDEVRKSFKFYIPLAGGEDNADSFSSGGTGFSVFGSTIKAALGRETPAEDIAAQIVQTRQRAIDRANKNFVAKKVLDFFLQLENDGYQLMSGQKPLIEIAPTDSYRYLKKGDLSDYRVEVEQATGKRNPSPQDILAYMRGKYISANATMEQAEKFAAREQARVNMRTVPADYDNSAFSVRVNGQDVIVRFNDQSFADAMRNILRTNNPDGLMAMARKAIGYQSALYTGLNPEFWLVNLPRDLLETGVKSVQEGYSTPLAMMREFPKALADAAKFAKNGFGSQEFERFRLSGGVTGFAQNIADLAGFTESLAADISGKGKVAKTFGSFKAVIELINKAGNVFENSVRYALWLALVKRGVSDEVAGQKLGKIAVNYNVKGAKSDVMGAAYIFFNPAVRGGYSLYDAMKSKKVQGAFLGLAGMYAAYAAMAAAAMGNGDDGEPLWNNDQVRRDRQYNLLIPLNLLGKEVKPGEVPYIKIPIAYGLSLFMAPGNWITGMYYGGDKAYSRNLAKESLDILSTFMKGFAPPPVGTSFDMGVEAGAKGAVLGLTPTLAQYVVFPQFNVNSFGAPIAPQKFSENAPDNTNMYKSTQGTVYDDMAGFLAELGGGKRYDPTIDVSPEVLKYQMNNITGVIAQLAKGLSADGDYSDKNPGEMVGVRKFVANPERVERGNTGKLYSRIDEINNINRQLKAVEELKDAETRGREIERIKSENPQWAMKSQAGSVRKQIGELNQKIADIRASDRTDAEKKLAIEFANRQIVEITNQFNRQYNERVGIQSRLKN